MKYPFFNSKVKTPPLKGELTESGARLMALGASRPYSKLGVPHYTRFLKPSGSSGTTGLSPVFPRQANTI
jgi:hypothetical protein